MLPRLLTFFYLTSWHERCNLLLYEFWVTLRPVGRTCLSIAACSVTGQEAGLAIKAPLRRPALLKTPRLHLNETRGGTVGGKSPWMGAKSAQSGLTVWWFDVTLSEAGWGFLASWEVERGGTEEGLKTCWHMSLKWTLQKRPCSDTPAGRTSVITRRTDQNPTVDVCPL